MGRRGPPVGKALLLPVCTPSAGLMTVQDFVRVTSTAAAQIFNLYPRKGRVAAGSDADVIVLDPDQEHVISARTHHSRLDTNVYEGESCGEEPCCEMSASARSWHRRWSVTWSTTASLVAPTCAGKPIKGKVIVTISRGRVVWEDGKLMVERGSGRFVRMPVFGSLFDGLQLQDAARLGREFPYGRTPVKREGPTEDARDEL